MFTVVIRQVVRRVVLPPLGQVQRPLLDNIPWKGRAARVQRVGNPALAAAPDVPQGLHHHILVASPPSSCPLTFDPGEASALAPGVVENVNNTRHGVSHAVHVGPPHIDRKVKVALALEFQPEMGFKGTVRRDGSGRN